MKRMFEDMLIFGLGVGAGVLLAKYYYERVEKMDETVTDEEKEMPFKDDDIVDKDGNSMSENKTSLDNFKRYMQTLENENYVRYESKFTDKESLKKPDVELLDAETEVAYDDDISKEAEMAEAEHPSEGIQTASGPYIIDLETFTRQHDDSGRYYDKMTLTYYHYQDVIVDEMSDDVIDGFVEYLGRDNLDYLMEHRDDVDNVVYIRNEKLGIDYEVTISDDDYEEVVYE